MWAEGDRLDVRRATSSEHDVVVEVAQALLATVKFSPAARTARLTIAKRSWQLRAYERGWRIAAFDAEGRVAASYADRWLLAGRLWLGSTVASVQVPLAWRSWTVRAEGARVLVLDRPGPLALVGALGNLPARSDHQLLVGFAAAVIWLRVRFRARPLASVHVIEGRAEALDDLLDAELEDDFSGDDLTS